jgi:putative DNA primase/helicase
VSPDQVVDQMQAAGLQVPPLPLDLSGRVQRFGPKKNQWYRLREVRTQGGSYVVTGSFGDWKGQESHRVEVDWKGIGDAERAELLQRRQAQAEADAKAKAEAAAQAAMTAAQLWASASMTGHSPYLQRKGVDGEACRYLRDGSIVVPLLRYDLPRDQALQACQTIKPDGTKRFTRGFAKAGCSVRLGHVVVGEPILIGEGYATGLTLRMAVERKLPVFVALDAGNLEPVAQLLRTLHPRSPLLICADDDWRTQGNPGRMRADQTCRTVDGCSYTWPVWTRGQTRGVKDTDFNDLQRLAGINVVRRQVRHALYAIGSDALNAK